MLKDIYIKKADERFDNQTKKLVLDQIELFFKKDIDISKNKYNIGEEVFLKKGTFIHGIFGGLENFDYTVQNGFVSTDFTSTPRPNKICNSVGMWNIKEDIYLKDYINLYSGFTITYTIGRGPESKLVSKLVSYHKFDEYTEKINNDEEIWTYWGDKTKEVSFLPSLVSNKRQISFILNMESAYAKEMAYADVWNLNLNEKIIEPFLDSRYYQKFIEERKNRTAVTTDRESAIVFGLPACLIEGVFVGRDIEKDVDSLKYIKDKLPDCYICNLDGKVIVSNK